VQRVIYCNFQKLVFRSVFATITLLLVLRAYKLVCLLFPTEKATPILVIGCLLLRIVLLLLFWVSKIDVIKLLGGKRIQITCVSKSAELRKLNQNLFNAKLIPRLH